MQDEILGYVVIGGRFTGPTRMVRTLQDAYRLERTWDRHVRRYYGGGYDASIAAVYRREDGTCYVTAGGHGSGTGLGGLGVAGEWAVKQAVEWISQRSSRWLSKHRIRIA